MFSPLAWFVSIPSPQTKIFLISSTDGEGKGFGNRISIQTVDVVLAAIAAGRMYEFDQDGQVREINTRKN